MMVLLQTFYYNTILIKLIARQGGLYIGKSLRNSVSSIVLEAIIVKCFALHFILIRMNS